MTWELDAVPEGHKPSGTFHLLTLVGYADEDIASASRSKVFELLLQLSYADVERYRSDYFHDARWLAEHFNTVPFAFLYCWNQYGTRIGTDPFGCLARGGGSTERAARIVVRYENHQVLVKVLRLDESAALVLSASGGTP